MSIIELGALGEFFGAILITTTLVYLAIQNQQRQKLLLSSVNQARTDARRDIQRIVLEYADVFLKEDMTEADRLRVQSFNALRFANSENSHYQHQLGIVSEELFEAARNNMKGMFLGRGTNPTNFMREDWTAYPASDSFRTWVDEIIQEIEQEEAA